MTYPENPKDQHHEHHQYDGHDLNQLIEQSAKRGARLALAEIGLGDDRAPRDLKDLRNLLIAWRKIRAQTMEAIFRLFIHIFLVAMLAVATAILWFNGR